MLDFKLYIVSYSNCTLGDKNYNMQIIIHADCIVSECNKNEFFGLSCRREYICVKFEKKKFELTSLNNVFWLPTYTKQYSTLY